LAAMASNIIEPVTARKASRYGENGDMKKLSAASSDFPSYQVLRRRQWELRSSAAISSTGTESSPRIERIPMRGCRQTPWASLIHDDTQCLVDSPRSQDQLANEEARREEDFSQGK
jgi:hypothetical protein